jgi:hypothetical protein
LFIINNTNKTDLLSEYSTSSSPFLLLWQRMTTTLQELSTPISLTMEDQRVESQQEDCCLLLVDESGW